MIKRILLIFFILGNLNSFSQVDFSQEVDFNYKQITLKDFLKNLETDFNISYSYGKLNTDIKTSFSFKGKLSSALEKYFTSLNLKYRIVNNHIILKNAFLKNLRNNIKGRIIDSDSKSVVIGASFIILNHEPFTGVASDIDGYFAIENLPIGRYDFKINSIGYEPKTLNQVELNSVKDLFLEIELEPSVSKVNEVVIYARLNKHEAINEMAMSSSRSFSVEETQRYAASISDPARMAQNYAGVQGENDLNNDIVIRGNSPRGLLWRLDGIDIPNPNHFSETGGKGGGVSMLNSSTLSNSDFYTSSFPAQFGNSLSGVFDLKLRKGNNSKREHSFKVGILGLEASTEGYFSKKSKASYLVNYRFLSLYFLKGIVDILKDVDLSFQDVSFKVFIPTKSFGSFSLFGIGGYNSTFEDPILDRKLWKTYNDRVDNESKENMGVVGLNHKIVITKKTYLNSHIAFTTKSQKVTRDVLDTIPSRNPKRTTFVDFNKNNLIFSSTLNHKFSSKHLIKLGAITTLQFYDYFYYVNGFQLNKFLNKDGNTTFLQNFIQWKYKISPKIITNIGVHFSYLFLNNSYAIDPRIGLKYKINEKHSLGFFVGQHSKPEHLTTYLIEDPNTNKLLNQDLKMTKAIHSVFSYQFKFAKDYNLKAELYYQYLYDVPVLKNENSHNSSINAFDVFDIISQNRFYTKEYVNKGTGQNFGIDLTIEKYFSKKYYAMLTASLFDSYYTSYIGNTYRTKFANNYLINLIGGKEFVVGKNKNNTISLNGKLIFNGGKRYVPIDLDQSIKLGDGVAVKDKYYTKQFRPYFRIDLGFKYIINTKNTTHTIMFDIQNTTNHKNISNVYFHQNSSKIKTSYQLGIIPLLSYKLDFSLEK